MKFVLLYARTIIPRLFMKVDDTEISIIVSLNIGFRKARIIE